HRALLSFPTRRSSDLTSSGLYRALRYQVSGVDPRRAGTVEREASAGGEPQLVADDVLPRPRWPCTKDARRLRGQGQRSGASAVEDRKSTRLNSSHVAI